MKQEECFDMFASSMLRFRLGGWELALIPHAASGVPHVAAFTDFPSQSPDSGVRI